MVPFFTSETAFRQHVGTLVFGVNVLDLDFGVQIDFVKIATRPQLCGYGTHVSSSDSLSFNDHLDYCTIVFENLMEGAKWESFAFEVT